MRLIPRRFQQSTERVQLDLRVWWRSLDRRLVIAAGMPRSASTLLYNTVRIVAEQAWPRQVGATFEKHLSNLPRTPISVIKTHDLTWPYRFQPGPVFYSYRDVRTVAVSAHRMFGYAFSAELLQIYLDEFLAARRAGAFFFRFEDMVNDLPQLVSQVSRCLEVVVDEPKILAELESLQAPADGEAMDLTTQLHHHHFTHTRDDEWRNVLPSSLQNQINRDFGWWFRMCGYPLS